MVRPASACRASASHGSGSGFSAQRAVPLGHRAADLQATRVARLHGGPSQARPGGAARLRPTSASRPRGAPCSVERPRKRSSEAALTRRRRRPPGTANVGRLAPFPPEVTVKTARDARRVALSGALRRSAVPSPEFPAMRTRRWLRVFRDRASPIGPRAGLLPAGIRAVAHHVAPQVAPERSEIVRALRRPAFLRSDALVARIVHTRVAPAWVEADCPEVSSESPCERPARSPSDSPVVVYNEPPLHLPGRAHSLNVRLSDDVGPKPAKEVRVEVACWGRRRRPDQRYRGAGVHDWASRAARHAATMVGVGELPSARPRELALDSPRHVATVPACDPRPRPRVRARLPAVAHRHVAVHDDVGDDVVTSLDRSRRLEHRRPRKQHGQHGVELDDRAVDQFGGKRRGK